jgi:hypothetical protein
MDPSRRLFLKTSGIAGLGAFSALNLLNGQAFAQQAAAQAPMNTGILGSGHLPARAKRVIHMHMLGAMSHVDTFDYKPVLVERTGQELPPSVKEGQRISTMSSGQSAFPIAGPVTGFAQHGQSGAWVSDALPHTAGIVDDLCFIKTVHTEHVNHDPAAKFLFTGFQIAGRPSIGAWVSYALGSDNRDLPNFVVMKAGANGGVPLDSLTWGAGFLPSHHQGVEFRAADSPVLYIVDSQGIDRRDRRAMLDALSRLAQTQYQASGDAETLSRVNQYEMAYRMQASVPEVADISDEPDYILDMYGPDVRTPGTFARNCLMARRLCERGVKYQVLFGMGWDHHSNIAQDLPRQCRMVDQPAAALVTDLKQRGLLEDTLVTFGAEFGRTPFIQGNIDDPRFGRDHHGGAFTWWMAGGGVKAGLTYGETDDFAYNIVKDPVHIHDLNATIMHLLGVDHERLTFRTQGRDFRLTDVHGAIVTGILA